MSFSCSLKVIAWGCWCASRAVLCEYRWRVLGASLCVYVYAGSIHLCVFVLCFIVDNITFILALLQLSRNTSWTWIYVTLWYVISCAHLSEDLKPATQTHFGTSTHSHTHTSAVESACLCYQQLCVVVTLQGLTWMIVFIVLLLFLNCCGCSTAKWWCLVLLLFLNCCGCSTAKWWCLVLLLFLNCCGCSTTKWWCLVLLLFLNCCGCSTAKLKTPPSEIFIVQKKYTPGWISWTSVLNIL